VKPLLAPFCLIAALAASPAQAAVLIDTSSPPPTPSNGSYTGYSMNSSKAGVVFTTGSGTSFTIESLSVFLRGGLAAIPSATVTVELFLGGAPTVANPLGAATATKQATLSLPATGSIGSPSVIAPQVINTGGGASWTLQASTQYFLALSTTTSGVVWVKASSNTAAVASGITYNGWGGLSSGNPYNFDTPGGNPAPWIIVSDTASGGGGSSAVPDAGPGPALALLLGGLGLRQWRHTRRTGAAA